MQVSHHTENGAKGLIKRFFGSSSLVLCRTFVRWCLLQTLQEDRDDDKMFPVLIGHKPKGQKLIVGEETTSWDAAWNIDQTGSDQVITFLMFNQCKTVQRRNVNVGFWCAYWERWGTFHRWTVPLHGTLWSVNTVCLCFYVFFILLSITVFVESISIRSIKHSNQTEMQNISCCHFLESL